MKLQTIKNVSRKGFTLIELLVVITIIGILATGATSTYTSQIQKARDTTRINDVKALQSAVEQVYQDAMEYPASNDSSTNNFLAILDYIDKCPEDSKHWKPWNISWGTAAQDSKFLGYTYEVWPDENGIDYWNYEISTWFEANWNITGKALTDGLWVAAKQDANRLEVWVASKTLWLTTWIYWTTAPADNAYVYCIIEWQKGCNSSD